MKKPSKPIPSSQKLFSKVFFGSRLFWKAVGDIESAMSYSSLEKADIDRPIFVTSLARSGTTVLLDAISKCDGVTTHQYKDFPFVFTPMLWSKIGNKFFNKDQQSQERFHKDGLMINRSSPEAMEEVIWSYFFKDSHNAEISNILDRSASNSKFEDFYGMHLKKMLKLRDGKRYASKANYHISRILYLSKLYPDAKFVIPYRNPVNHVYSLIKQHKLFMDVYSKDKYISKYLGYAGHYEFGADFRPINYGNNDETKRILDLFASQDYVSAYAHLWSNTYSYLLDIMESNSDLKKNITIVEYEQFCEETESKLEQVLVDIDLKVAREIKLEICENTILPKYYSLDLSSTEQKNILEITDNVYKKIREKAV